MEGRTWNLFGIPDFLRGKYRGRLGERFGLPRYVSDIDFGQVGEDIGLTKATPEEFRRREIAKQTAYRFGQAGTGPQAEALPYSMAGIQQDIESREAAAIAKAKAEKAAADQEDQFDKYMKMQLFSKVIASMQPKQPGQGYTVSVGTTKQPVAATLMSTIPQRRQRDDLLNYMSGGMRGRV